MLNGWSGEGARDQDREWPSLTSLGFPWKVVKEPLKDFKQGSGGRRVYAHEHAAVWKRGWRLCSVDHSAFLLHTYIPCKSQAQNGNDLGPSFRLWADQQPCLTLFTGRTESTGTHLLLTQGQRREC